MVTDISIIARLLCTCVTYVRDVDILKTHYYVHQIS